MPAGFHLKQLLDKPEALTGLMEAARSPGRHPFTDRSYLQQFLFSLPVRTGFGLLFCKCGITACITDNGGTAHDYSFQEAVLSGIVPVAHIAGGQFPGCFSDNALQTDFQYFFILDGYMSHTIIKIIPRRKDIMFNRSRRFRRHIGKSKLACGFPFPVFMYFP